jgi:hypothetical protein
LFFLLLLFLSSIEHLQWWFHWTSCISFFIISI